MNPPGQLPFPDSNAGYECDSNHGIGQTNPAHTGCVPPPVPPPVPPQPAVHPVSLTSLVPGVLVLRAAQSLISQVPTPARLFSPSGGLAFTGSGILVLFIAGMGALLGGETLRRSARVRVARRFNRAAAS